MNSRDLILKHWKPLRLRALRHSRGLTLKDISNATGIKVSQISAWELAGKFDGYKHKSLIYGAYRVAPEELEPQPEQVDRIQQLLCTYSREEIQLAFDLQGAEERCQRNAETRARNNFSSKYGIEA